MSSFISYTDYETRLTPRILKFLTDDNDYLLNNAETEAVGIITDRLADKYSIAAEFAKTGSARNSSLIRWVLAIAIYTLYSRIPDEELPERIIKDYDDAIRELEMIAQGKLRCTLTLLTDSEGETVSRIRMGSNDPRTHNPFEYP
jgi:phage gp36-like protein